MAASYVVNLSINAGANFSQSFTLASDGNLLDLTNYEITAVLRKHPLSSTSVSFSTAIDNENVGVLRLTMSSILTSQISPGRHVYDVIIRNNNTNEITRVIEGTIIVTTNVTR
jgi:hypothetical protein